MLWGATRMRIAEPCAVKSVPPSLLPSLPPLLHWPSASPMKSLHGSLRPCTCACVSLCLEVVMNSVAKGQALLPYPFVQNVFQVTNTVNLGRRESDPQLQLSSRGDGESSSGFFRSVLNQWPLIVGVYVDISRYVIRARALDDMRLLRLTW